MKRPPREPVRAAIRLKRPPREPVRAAIRLVDEERSRLNIATLVSIRTIESYAAGFPVHRTTRIRIERELQKMGIDRKEREKTAARGRRRRVVDTPAEHAA